MNRDRVEALAQPDDRIAEAVCMAEAADVTILCLGLDATIEGEEGDAGNSFASGDKLTLELPESQRILLKRILETGKPVILVLAAGSSLNPHAEKAAAILQAWYPGEAGGTALANILFGKVSPSGKLPVTFYETVTKLPDFMDYSMKGRTYRYAKDNVLYPFGYGLTYSKTAVYGMDYDGEKVLADIANIGDRDTDDVVQLYIRDLESPDEVENLRLCGFKRVSLKAGQKMTVEIIPDRNAFTVINEEGVRVPGSGHYRLWAGTHQPDELSEKLTGTHCVSISVKR